MISHISIKDFAIIEHAEIDFHKGLNIITGETGAGKSIVIEAISLALGSRADTTLIRSGKDRAVIQLVADIDEKDMVFTREITMSGKNLCRINGELVTLTQLSNLCKKFADIHGQYDHQSLLNPDNHIHLVDSYGHLEITTVKSQVAEHFNAYRDISRQLSSLLSGAREFQRKRDFMIFELDEISKARLVPGEDLALSRELSLLQNSEKIFQNLSDAYELIHGDNFSACDSLGKAMHCIKEISSYSPALTILDSDFSDIYYKLEDMGNEIRQAKEHATFSPEALEETLERLDLINTLKRKYGNSIEEILAYGNRLTEDLSAIENADELKQSLSAKLSAKEKQLELASQKLSKLRRKSAKELESKIVEELKALNFNNSELSIHFNDQPSPYTESGTDIVEFLISTNKGEPLKPLAKIASGGEMSRIMLAFKKIIADYDQIGTMIFDEIDSGVSGIAASIVGRKLKEISKSHQIICITHLPQIAAFGQHNYKIAKESDDSLTYTTVLPLTADEKVNEISRLLGGINITDTTRLSAKELIKASE